MDTNELKHKGEKFSIHWDPNERILFTEMWGAHNKKDAEEYRAKFKEFLEKIPGTASVCQLYDLSKQKKTDHEARRIYTEISKYPRAGTSAICGANILIRVVTNFIATATGRKNSIKSFAAVEEGLKWLRETKAKKK
jgi:hypothetical protein